MINQTITLVESQLQEDEAYLISTDDSSPHLIEGALTLGRDSSNTISLRDPHVSAFHCQVEKRPQGYFIRDLKSRNGVHVNGVKISEAQLLDGARIHLGSTEFIFQTQKPIPSEDDGELALKHFLN
jgi:pSer/pThr/pTyr-binding forkhead associated (FHA) protein